MAKTFVYDGTEVRLTGRTAIRQVRNSQFKLVEITPIDEDMLWKKWINPDHLYEVIEEEKTRNATN